MMVNKIEKKKNYKYASDITLYLCLKGMSFWIKGSQYVLSLDTSSCDKIL